MKLLKQRALIALMVILFTGVFILNAEKNIVYSQGTQSANKPVIASVTIDKVSVSGGTNLTVTVTATSNSPVTWINRSFSGPAGNIYDGGSGVVFSEVGDQWVYTWTDFISEHAPSGTYAYSNISVRNEGMVTSDVWPDPVSTVITNSSSPAKPTIDSVTLDKESVSGGTNLTVTVTATSNSPVTWINRSFSGPVGNIYGGGSEVVFAEVGGKWVYTWTDFITEYAPSGTYAYSNISVKNEGMMTSGVWLDPVSTIITNSSSPSKPVIDSINLESTKVAGGTNLTVTIRVLSNSPVTWLNRSFYGPSGNIYGGGSGVNFTDIGSNTWEYTWTDLVSQYAPSGRYYYKNISVTNEGMQTSDLWPDEPGEVINNTLNPSPEVVEVTPIEGTATATFPSSDVTIEITTTESGTISVTRYSEHGGNPPTGASPAGIYLDINPSLTLQGKPATFTVGYSLPLPEGVEESTLKLYRWSGSAWTVIPDQVLDTEAKTITASVTGFSTFGLFGTSTDADSRARQTVITRFSRIFNYSGIVDHEHKYNLINGVAGLVAAGKGDLGGTHEGATLESGRRNAYYSNAFYNITTAQEALPSEYLRIVSAYSDGTERASRSGIETKPGGTGSISESAASASDSKGSYSTYSSTVETSDGQMVVESAVDDASISVNVEGTGFVHFSVTTDGGGQKTGWWDIP